MSETIITPLDQQTGVPLPLLSVEPRRGQRDAWTDYHHTFFHREDPELKGQAGRALRYSRGQVVPRWLHDAYHHAFTPPRWPSSESEKFRLCVLGSANMIGPLAVDMTKDDPSVPVLITPEQYERLTNSQYMHYEYAQHPTRARRRREDIGRFFASYSIRHGTLGCTDDNLIAEFLDTKRHERKVELGNLMLKQAIVAVVEPIVPVASGLLENIDHPAQTLSPEQWLRRTVRRFFEKRRFTDYYGMLSEQLLAVTA